MVCLCASVVAYSPSFYFHFWNQWCSPLFNEEKYDTSHSVQIHATCLTRHRTRLNALRGLWRLTRGEGCGRWQGSRGAWVMDPVKELRVALALSLISVSCSTNRLNLHKGVLHRSLGNSNMIFSFKVEFWSEVV